MSDDEVRVQRCPSCRSTFQVMADEAGMHACPRCGFSGYECEYCGSKPATRVRLGEEYLCRPCREDVDYCVRGGRERLEP
jgi:hypothetical protein